MDEINRIWPKWNTGRLIGRGSFGSVYEVSRNDLGHEVKAAVKILHIPQAAIEIDDLRSTGMSDTDIQRYYEGISHSLLEEIRIMVSLKTANNVVSIEDYEIIPHEDGIGWSIYIRMELLESLSEVLRRGVLPVHEAVQLGIDLCGALRNCESAHIIHRDIKPDNIFRTQFATYKLGDFGIARQMEQTRGNYSQKGTPNYMAPEIFRGKKYDRTVDIYSLGVVLYRLLNQNRLPFLPPAPQPITPKDTDYAFVQRMSGQEMPKPSEADDRLAEIILRACAFEPEKRYSHAIELEYALRDWLKDAQQGEAAAEEAEQADVDNKEEKARKGEDIRITLTIDAEEAENGCRKLVAIDRPEQQRTQKLEVHVPAGITTGKIIRLVGQGKPGSGGGAAGNLLLTVQVRPPEQEKKPNENRQTGNPIDERFRQAGSDVYLNMPLEVDAQTAKKGGVIRVPTPKGDVKFTLPAKTKNVQMFCLPGMGMDPGDGGKCGDEYFTVSIRGEKARKTSKTQSGSWADTGWEKDERKNKSARTADAPPKKKKGNFFVAIIVAIIVYLIFYGIGRLSAGSLTAEKRGTTAILGAETATETTITTIAAGEKTGKYCFYFPQDAV